MAQPPDQAAIIKGCLETLYKRLTGVRFQATYEGCRTMPQTGNARDVLVVDPSHPFAQVLKQISSSVLLQYGTSVWKGITGPEEKRQHGADAYTDYWLWVEPTLGAMVQQGEPRNFIIQSATFFPCNEGTGFTFGMNLIAIEAPLPVWSTEFWYSVWYNFEQVQLAVLHLTVEIENDFCLFLGSPALFHFRR